MTIHENATIEAKNLMTFRGNYNPQQMREMMLNLEQYIKSSGAKKSGMPITAVYSSDKATGTTETQVFVPIDREISSSQNFSFLGKLSVENCLMTKHKGNPQLVPTAYEALIAKAKSSGYKLLKPSYNVIVTEPTPVNMSDFEMDIFFPIDN